MLNSVLKFFLLLILPLSVLSSVKTGYKSNTAIAYSQNAGHETAIDSAALSKVIEEISKKEKTPSLLNSINKALAASKEIGFDKGTAQCYFLLGEIYENNKQHQDAAKQFLTAKNYFLKSQDSLQSAGSFVKAANNYHSVQKYELAEENYKAALNIYEKLNPNRDLSAVYTNLGVLYDYAGDYSNAMFYYIKAYELDKSLNDTIDFPTHFNNIGQVFTSLQLYNKAIEYLEKSVESSIAAKDSLTLSYAYVGLNNVYLLTKNADLAHSYITKAIDIQNKIPVKDYPLLSIAYTDIARVYIAKKDYNKAKQALDLSFNIASKKRLIYPQLYSLAYTAKLYNSLKEYVKAEQTINRAMEIYKNYKMIPIRITILNQLKETYAKQSLFEKAYKVQEEIYALKQANTYESHIKNVSELSAGLDFSQEQKLNNIKASQQKDELVVRIEKQKIIILFTILLLTSIGILAFNSIKNHKTQKAINNALLQKNKEIEANRIEIDKQSKALAQLNEHKDIIFTIVSHDLRRPLAQLSSVLELLENKLIDEQELVALIPQISKNVKNTSQVLDSLLVWAKSQLKGFSLKVTENNLFTFVNEKIQTLIPFALEKNIQIINNISPSLNLKIDALLTTIIIRNFVLNAIKFSNESQSIVISAESDNNFHYITVKDEGIGMDEEQLKSLFGPQTKSTLGTKKEKGTGLGLVFCKDLIEKSGGKLIINSVPGKGTTISFSIPFYS